MDRDRIFCPSTDEVIFAPDYEEINENAEAFIAYWHGEVLNEPSITDEKLKAAWDEYYEKWKASEDIDIWDSVEKFLIDYENPSWKVCECTFHGMACGPISTTVYFVVKADTVIEEDPNIDNEKVEIADKTEKEIEDEIIARQIRSLLR
jgi:hypothetical protein